MDKIVDYIESFIVSLELSGNNGVIKIDKQVIRDFDYLIVYDCFIYNVGTLITISFDRVSGEYYMVLDKYLQQYAANRYQVWKFRFNKEEEMLNILEHLIKIIEEQFEKRLKMYGIYRK